MSKNKNPLKLCDDIISLSKKMQELSNVDKNIEIKSMVRHDIPVMQCVLCQETEVYMINQIDHRTRNITGWFFACEKHFENFTKGEIYVDVRRK